MKKGDEFNIPDEEILAHLGEKAPEVVIKVDDVRRELRALVSEPGVGNSIQELLEVPDDAIAFDAGELISRAIENILAQQRSNKIEQYPRDSRRDKMYQPIVRGRKGPAKHQQQKRKEIDDSDTDA